jgi:hypothetical protein
VSRIKPFAPVPRSPGGCRGCLSGVLLAWTFLFGPGTAISRACPPDPCDENASCPWCFKQVTASDVAKCSEATATIELTAPASQDVLVEVTLHTPEDDPQNPHPNPPPPGDAIFRGVSASCEQGDHRIFVCIPQDQTSTTVTYFGMEVTDDGYPMTLDACIATSTCGSITCDGTCDPTNCQSVAFYVRPSDWSINVGWASNPTNMISVNGDYEENNPTDQRDNEGEPRIVAGDDELKDIVINITGTGSIRGRWKVSGAPNVKLWKSLTEALPMGQQSGEVTTPYSTTLTMEGIAPSTDLDGTTLTASFTPSDNCGDPVTHDMSFTVVKAEITSAVVPDKYEADSPGQLMCANDDYDEGGPAADNADEDPEHNSTGALVLDEMVPVGLEVKPDTAAFFGAVTVKLWGLGDVLRGFGVHNDPQSPDWALLSNGQSMADYFGTGPKSNWDVLVEGVGAGPTSLSLVVKRGVYEVARDQAAYTVGQMTVTPTSGQIGTVLTIAACPACAEEIGESTTVTFTGTFQPDGYEPTEQFSVTYSDEVYYDPAHPGQVKIILGEVMPGSGSFWSNPGVQARATGRLVGSIQVGSCSTGVAFTVQDSSYQIGHVLAGGTFQPETALLALPINDSTDVCNMTDPDGDGSYVARVVATINESPPAGSTPPATMTATIRCRANGELISEGVATSFDLYSYTATEYEYRSHKIILFNDSTAVEGEFSGAVVVQASVQGAGVEIVAQP